MTKKKTILISLLVIAVGTVGCNTTVTEEPKNERTQEQNSASAISNSAIDKLIQQLNSDDWETREKAQKELEDWPIEKIGEIEPVIKGATQDKSPETRQRAGQIIKIIELKKRIKFSDAFVKEFPNIYSDLTILNTHGKFVLFEKIVCNHKVHSAITTKDMAGLIDEVLSEGIDSLTRNQQYIIVGTIQGTGIEVLSENERLSSNWRTPVKESIPQLLKLLKPNSCVRNPAIEALSCLDAKEAIPQIMELINDESVRSNAINALAYMDVKEAIPEILKYITDENKFVRESVAYALGRLKVKESIPELIKMLSDEYKGARSAAIFALKEIDAKESIPKIIKLLDDADDSVCSSAAIALAELNAKEAIPKLRELLNGKDGEVVQRSVWALGKLNAKEAVPQILQRLKDNSNCIFTINALGKLEAKEAIPELMKILKHGKSIFPGYAAEALGFIGAKESIPELMKLLDDESYVNGCYAALALGKLGVKDAIPKIIKFLDHEDIFARILGAIALIELGQKNKIPKKIIEEMKGIKEGESEELIWPRIKSALKELGVEIKENK